jgi:ribonuclease J
MEIIIHRGAAEIGGNCVELIHEGKSILLDFGMPLNSNTRSVPETLSPERISAVVVSHTHQDHIGLADMLPHIPVYIGEGALGMAREASLWIKNSVRLPNAVTFKPSVPFNIAGFSITAYPVDHSAFDSYTLLIGAGGKRVLYSGDFRESGYAAYKTKNFMDNPPKDIDLLLMEGTTVGNATHDNIRESSLVDRICRAVGADTGLVMLAASGQNIDRLITVYKAAGKLKRKFVIDAYAYSMLKTTGVRSIIGALSGISVFIHQRQRLKIKEEELFDRLCPYNQRVYLKNLIEAPNRYIVLFRRDHMGCFKGEILKNAVMIYSMWKKYLEEDETLRKWLESNNIRLEYIHTSGHADTKTLAKFADAVNPKILVPIHTENPEMYQELFKNVTVTDKIAL